MYQPREFAGEDAATAYDHIRRHPFGIVVSAPPPSVQATHLPFLLDDEEHPSGLLGHFSRRNRQWRSIEDGDEVLCVFPGPNAYVSPTLYTAEEDVPTWNYTAVHVRGSYARIDGARRLRDLLERTVEVFERGSARPWGTASMPPADLVSLARGVVGFEVRTTGIEGGYKLSQDRLRPDVDAVLSGLAGSGDPGGRAVAAEMRRHGVRGRTAPPSTDPASWPPEEFD
ncbi:FMN-binding negative transcriptional regulator [Nocardiopsis composta]|uniref:Transcriptional regulator n=1 Tax=Nocardiopsis composta TaxID=157465 RepID=A0A7W8QS40_9ACTN|nr:FMN-binding negative transcriptional regulator [Nocardiopsis composta]MBB5435607.1 transcriptional regulator [Nocardiopsis composta]